jgi:hypothetical protein
MRGPLFLVALCSSGLIACAVPGPESGSDPSTGKEASSATAIIVVERTAGPGDAVRGDAVIARFVRVSQGAVDEPALRMAGVTADLPAPSAMGANCFVPNDNPPAYSHGRAVELLDVGQVTLNSASAVPNSAENTAKTTMLLPRSMPDPAGVVSGVFYSSRSADVFAAGSRVSLRSNGGADLLDGFNVSVTAPRDVSDVRVSPNVVGGLDVSWDATDSDAHDLVYVDILSPAPRVGMRCTVTDTGHVAIPSQVEEGQVAVHRLHKETFKAKGIEPGEVRFDVAKILNFHR